MRACTEETGRTRRSAREAVQFNTVPNDGNKIKPIEKVKPEKWKFEAAKDIDEVKTRLSKSMGIKEINLGNMKPELANQYLEGIEIFTNDYPQVKGFLGGLDTKTKSREFGAYRMRGVPINDGHNYDLSNSLSLKSPKDIKKMYKTYEIDSAKGFGFKGADAKATVIHEYTHVLDSMLTAVEKGAFVDGKFTNPPQTVFGVGEYFGGYANRIISEAHMDVFGKKIGKDVYEGTKYLGQYAMTSKDEMLAQCISYEYSGKTNPFSAKVKEIFDKKVKEILK